MALQTDGIIKISEIRDEFNLNNPVSLSTAADANSLTGSISMSNFYGASNGITFTLLETTEWQFFALSNSFISGVSTNSRRSSIGNFIVRVNGDGILYYELRSDSNFFDRGNLFINGDFSNKRSVGGVTGSNDSFEKNSDFVSDGDILEVVYQKNGNNDNDEGADEFRAIISGQPF